MDRLYIIGNGFDIDLGMETRYSDFIKSSEFNALTKNSADAASINFANYLLVQHRDNWIDMETALKKYVSEQNDLDSEVFQNVYEDIKSRLCVYLVKQESKFLESISEVGSYYGSSNAINLIRKIKSEIKNSNNIKIINFNYTSRVFKRLFDRVDVTNNQNLVNIIHIHGTLEANSGLVLGIEDTALSPERENFGYIKKGRDVNFANTDMYNSYNKAAEITVFGHSLGESDVMHFKPMFEHIFEERKSHNITFNFYNDGDPSAISARIDRLVNGKIGQFKGICNLRFNPEFVI